jgi:hypothetical protein
MSKEDWKPGVVTQMPSPALYLSISVDSNGNIERIATTAETIPEAKLAIKELKMLKKAFQLQKRQINERQRIIRAEYTQYVRERGMKFPGGGWIGQAIRIAQSASRENAKSKLAEALEPYEQQKRYVEAVISTIEGLILGLEAAILQAS